MRELLPDTGVYLDIGLQPGLHHTPDARAYTPQELQLLDAAVFCKMVRRFGSERVLFGTDSPWTDQAASVAQIEALPLTRAEKDEILGGNASGCWACEPQQTCGIE